MKLEKFCYGIAVVLLVFGIQSCSDASSSSLNDEDSRIQLVLVDAPGDYLEVNVQIIDIQYNSIDDEEGWKSFTPQSGYPIDVNLTELIAGNSLLLTDEIIPSGMLKQIRLVLSDDNYLVIEEENGEPSEPIHLKTPSAQQSGLKLKLDEELEPGFSYTFILDWDVDKSIVKAGNSGNYNLKPVINVNAEVNSGTLKGSVIGKINPEDSESVALEGVLVEVFSVDDLNNSVSSTQTDDRGDFMFQGLAGGSYVLKIMHLGYLDYESEIVPGILIEVGMINELPNSIELLLADSLKGTVVGKLLPDDLNPVTLGNVTVELFDAVDLDNALSFDVTNVDGVFSFQGLATNSYVLKIVHEGYQNYESSSIDVEYGVLNELTENIELLLVQ
ncbi:DUF4382 domain-containing protein [Urechidicola vernalis]|uniref:DUF4382 domain-containing protein n=1 Tax=Urechidicola vernalis TaxID=3075600 RepID=A0ABU2Y335_9FLAO|nr:DUF4382 domain-containing protein [Urechidicola sp. P050]MDT0552624.1 DUF4382 domain-containing protein [Urechidicola sp. P050]